MQTERTPFDLVQQRGQAHALLNVLTVEKFTAVRSLLEVTEPLSRSLTLAPLEEELTDETAAGIAGARAVQILGYPERPGDSTHLTPAS